jgi:hypothetical protein
MAMVFAILVGVAGGGLLIRWLHRYENPRLPGPASAGSPVGIRGWLVFPALGTVLSPLLVAFTFYVWRSYFDAGVWANLGAGQDPVVAHWGKIALFGAIASAGTLLVGSVFLNYLLFTRRRAFPAGYIAALWIGSLWGLLIQLSEFALGVSQKYIDAAMIRDLIMAALWSLYMMRSARVRATFVRTRVAPSGAEIEQPVVAAA